MILIILLAAIALMALSLFVLIRGPNLPIRNLAELETLAQPVDLDAFKNLIDPQEIEFLRSTLSHKDFSRVEKQRKRVLVAYLQDIARNCVLLMRVAEAAAENPDAEVRVFAKKLADAALECRLLALRQLVGVHLTLILPVRVDQVAQSYSSLSSALGRFSMATEPGLTSRVVAAI